MSSLPSSQSSPAVKLVALLTRNPTITREAFEQHYETTHVPLTLSVHPYIMRYVRNYVQHSLNTLDSVSSAGCDVITEIWFAKEEDFTKFNEVAMRPDVRRRIVEDEEKFFDRESMRIFIVREIGGDVPS